MELENENKGWWSKKTSMEKTLTVLVALCTLVSIGLLVGLIVVAVKSNDHNQERVSDTCTSHACIQQSSQLIAHMNLTADPCDNFYEFTCGRFMAETVIPDNKARKDSFDDIDTKIKEQLRAIVTEPIVASEIAPFQTLKRLYQACVNTALIDKRGLTPVLNTLNLMGGWPCTLKNWNGSTWSWQWATAAFNTYGYLAKDFISFLVLEDDRNTTLRVVKIDQAVLGLSREYLIKLLDHDFVKFYHSYQVDLAVMMGADRTVAETEMSEVLNFEYRLANISMPDEDRRDESLLYNPMTIAEIEARYPMANHNWLAYFNSLMPAETQLVAGDTIIVGALTFFEQLGPLLAATPQRVLANYLMWRHALASVDYLPTAFRQRQQLYNGQTTGRETPEPRWLVCVNEVLSFFPNAFGALYVRKHFNEKAKAKVVEMVDNIKAEFKEILKDIDWMDAVTKNEANSKIDKMSSQIGFIDELMNDTAILEYYNSFTIDGKPLMVNENQYYESYYSLNSAWIAGINKKLREPVNKDDLASQETPAISNAFYDYLKNLLLFPAGILQGAFYNPDRPAYMNYGGIGFVIAHEITHGFDDRGSQRDADGNLRNWWTPTTKLAFLEKAQCIINQYRNYTEQMTGLKLNGINTQGENIADNGGIKESYRAYVRWAKDHPEPKLPGLSFTPQQLFWISHGHTWCVKNRNETMINSITTDTHSPYQFRVIGPLSNSKEFADDFQCAAGSKMNPVSKCSVW